MSLADAFERMERYEAVNLDLQVKVYNINKGYNEELKGKSEHLRGYSYFVERVRYYEKQERKQGTPKEEITLKAIRAAIEDCVEADILKDFWERLTKEDIMMLSTEWDINLALEVCKEENYEKGLATGIKEGKKEDQMEILDLINQGYTLEQLKERLASRLGDTQTISMN
jgi:hypothetical protein